jgi:hypothetical protein
MPKVANGRRKRAYRPKTRSGCLTCKSKRPKSGPQSSISLIMQYGELNATRRDQLVSDVHQYAVFVTATVMLKPCLRRVPSLSLS